MPTTGYVTNNAALFNDTYLRQYGCTVATFASCPTYIRQRQLRANDAAPARTLIRRSRAASPPAWCSSRSATVSFTADFFDIKKTGAITTPQPRATRSPPTTRVSRSRRASRSSRTRSASASRTPPRVSGWSARSWSTPNTIHSQGLDIGGTARFDLADDIRYTISGEGSVLFDFSTTFPGRPQGEVRRHARQLQPDRRLGHAAVARQRDADDRHPRRLQPVRHGQLRRGLQPVGGGSGRRARRWRTGGRLSAGERRRLHHRRSGRRRSRSPTR